MPAAAASATARSTACAGDVLAAARRPPAPARRRGSRRRGRARGGSPPRSAAAARSGTDDGRRDPGRAREEARAGRPARPRRPGRRASRGTRASPARRGSPSVRRTRRPSAVRPSSSRSDEMSKVGARRPEPRQRPAMDAADPAGREHPDPGRSGRDHRRRDGRRRPAAVGQRRRQAGPGGLADRAGRSGRERLERGIVQPDEQPAGMDRDRRRDGAGRADGRLGCRRATSRFCGYGRPWLMSVDSRATTGRPSASAAATSGLMSRRSVIIGGVA